MKAGKTEVTLGSRMPQPVQDKVFDTVNVTVMVILGVIFLWPLLFVTSASFSDPSAVWQGKVIFLPVRPNVKSYQAIFAYQDIWIGYWNTILYTVIGTAVNVVMTICAAYPLSRKDFMMRNILMFLFMFTMFFGGGLIPTYLVVRDLHLRNTFWALIIPSAVSIFNVIIARTYFQTSIPISLQEAAELDGASTLQFLLRIVLPLSKPILAVLALYYGVGHWNSYFDALIYLDDKKLYPLQMFLRDILIQNQMSGDMMMGMDASQAAAKAQLAQIIKYGVIIVSSVPMLCVYPFIQKYFVKGVMIGSIKG